VNRFSGKSTKWSGRHLSKGTHLRQPAMCSLRAAFAFIAFCVARSVRSMKRSRVTSMPGGHPCAAASSLLQESNISRRVDRRGHIADIRTSQVGSKNIGDDSFNLIDIRCGQNALVKKRVHEGGIANSNLRRIGDLESTAHWQACLFDGRASTERRLSRTTPRMTQDASVGLR